jgi:periplasmic protein TonB
MNDLGNLSSCVMDSDTGTAGRARRMRREAFIASLFLEAVLVGAMLLWPLITPGVLPQDVMLTPVPPYHATREATTTIQSRGNAGPAPAITPIFLHPTIGRPRTTSAPGGEPLGPNYSTLEVGQGPSIPGGSNDGRPIEVPIPLAPKGPVKVSAGVMAAMLVQRVQPEYPAIAKAMQLSGIVELRARIGTDGTVQQLEVVSGNPILARAAVEAVERWRYQPTRLNGQPVEVETHITVTFSIQQ